MQTGRRYLIMQSGPNLFEETTFFEIVTNAWVPLDQMKQLLTPKNTK